MQTQNVPREKSWKKATFPHFLVSFYDKLSISFCHYFFVLNEFCTFDLLCKNHCFSQTLVSTILVLDISPRLSVHDYILQQMFRPARFCCKDVEIGSKFRFWSFRSKLRHRFELRTTKDFTRLIYMYYYFAQNCHLIKGPLKNLITTYNVRLLLYKLNDNSVCSIEHMVTGCENKRTSSF